MFAGTGSFNWPDWGCFQGIYEGFGLADTSWYCGI